MYPVLEMTSSPSGSLRSTLVGGRFFSSPTKLYLRSPSGHCSDQKKEEGTHPLTQIVNLSAS